MSDDSRDRCIEIHDATPLAKIREAPDGTIFAAARYPGGALRDALAERAQRKAFALQLSHGGCGLLEDARLSAYVESLALSGANLDRLVLPPKLRALRLSGGSGSLHALLALPLEILAIDRGAFDSASLVEHATLAALSLANLPAEAASVGPRLRALRTIGVPLRTLDTLRSGIALVRFECVRCDALESIEALAALPALRELGLEGCWRLDLHATIAFLQRLPLRELRIDIGGRRKNVEVDKRLKLARLTPFPTPESVRHLRQDGLRHILGAETLGNDAA
ncbi:MAG: hypothetical protein HKL92_01265 [Candidatus Eremiobacteraeota bacterium]|nr:hypothetical protein [Candidatus Eremiobacteraeota bacterium]